MTKSTAKVAIITGGTSGIGLAVAGALSQRADWQVNILGTNDQRGHLAMKKYPKLTFHNVDVTNYNSLATTFHSIFTNHSRVDFVFANAGISGNVDFYDRHPAGEIPPQPSTNTSDINFTGVMYTSYLALHYFRQSPEGGKGTSLLFTGSCGSFYPCGLTPVYGATKHGVLGFMRSIAPFYWLDGIRVNALCPATVRTNIMTEDLWELFDADLLIPMEVILGVTLPLIDGEDMVDSTGTKIAAEEMHGRAVLVSGDRFYFKEQDEWVDEKMERCMRATMTGAL